jgi:hypothetical protein
MFFLDRIGINVRARRNFSRGAQGRNTMTRPLAVELPPVIRAFDVIALDLAPGQRSAAMNTGVTEALRRTIFTAKHNEILA